MSNKLTKHQPKTVHTKEVIHHQTTNHYQGPIPSPDHLAGYEAISAGFADRIIKMAEDQANHRFNIESKSIDADIKLQNRMIAERRAGQFMAFAIAVLFPCLGAYLVTKGFKIEGSIFGGVGLIPVIYAFAPKKDKNGDGRKP